MGHVSLSSFLVLLVSTAVLCDDTRTSEEKMASVFKKEMFDIYMGAFTKQEEKKSNVTRDQITFRMFRNQPEPKEAVLNDTDLHLLDGTKGNIVFITHGWTHSSDELYVVQLKDAFLVTYSDWVVITVDWRKPAHQMYSQSAKNVYDVGNFIGDTIATLVKDHGLAISQFLITGHSLGGQTSGFVGKRLQKKYDLKAPRIVALDPAGPLFDDRSIDERLNPTDADVVMVIHTDGDGFGFKDPCGTIDFFPNGGTVQPGCDRINMFDPTSVIDQTLCDHMKACYYFIEAVRQPANHLMGVNCSKWSYLQKTCDYDAQVAMGDLTTKVTGRFYLNTNKEKPYNIKEQKEATGLMDRVNKATNKFMNLFSKKT